MKKYVLNRLLIGSLLVGTVSCTGKYLDINTNPYEPGDLIEDDYALGSAMSNLASTVISADVNTAQFTDCLLGCPLGGYFAESNAGWENTISNFDAKNDWTRVLMNSDKIIPVLYSNLATVKQVSELTGNPVPYAIAQIIKVAAMNRVTDTYGPIPYSHLGASNNVVVPYDSQEQVYDQFFDELNDAITTLTENKDEKLVASADYVYSGDVQKWIKFANSLKLRLAIRIAYVKPDKAREMAESAITQEFGVIESNEDNAAWHYFGTIANPLYTAINYNSKDNRVAADIICFMNGYKDPRRASYFEESSWEGGGYIGIRRCIDRKQMEAYFTQYSAIKMSASDAVQWMNAAEVAFLRAEGKAVFNFNMGGEAKQFYEDGIRLSFEQWGATGLDTYLGDSKSIPESYVDPSGLNSVESNPTDITIAWDESASLAEKQERIITQKWIANWVIGHEAWCDYRRTGFPKLFPATSAGNRSGGVVDNVKGARRMPYPSEEYTSNTANVEYARDHYLGGLDNMATDVWWAKH